MPADARYVVNNSQSIKAASMMPARSAIHMIVTGQARWMRDNFYAERQRFAAQDHIAVHGRLLYI